RPEDLPQEAAAERQFYEATGVFSALNVPIKTASGMIEGCLGLHAKTRPIAWSDTDVEYVKMVGDAIATVIERKHTEQALRESEQRYRDFIAHSNEGVWRVELEQPVPLDLPPEEAVSRILQFGYFAECNEAHARIRGFSRIDEVIGKHLGELNPESDERKATYLAAAKDGYQSATLEFRGRDQAG